MSILNLGQIGTSIAIANVLGGGTFETVITALYTRIKDDGTPVTKATFETRWNGESTGWDDFSTVKNPLIIEAIETAATNEGFELGKFADTQDPSKGLIPMGTPERGDSGGYFFGYDENGAYCYASLPISTIFGLEFRGQMMSESNFPYVQNFYRSDLKDNELEHSYLPDLVLSPLGAQMVTSEANGIHFIYRDTRVVTHEQVEKAQAKLAKMNAELDKDVPKHVLSTNIANLCQSMDAVLGKKVFTHSKEVCLPYADTIQYHSEKGFDIEEIEETRDYYAGAETTTTKAENNAAAVVISLKGVPTKDLTRPYIESELTKGNSFSDIETISNKQKQNAVTNWIKNFAG